MPFFSERLRQFVGFIAGPEKPEKVWPIKEVCENPQVWSRVNNQGVLELSQDQINWMTLAGLAVTHPDLYKILLENTTLSTCLYNQSHE